MIVKSFNLSTNKRLASPSKTDAQDALKSPAQQTAKKVNSAQPIVVKKDIPTPAAAAPPIVPSNYFGLSPEHEQNLIDLDDIILEPGRKDRPQKYGIFL